MQLVAAAGPLLYSELRRFTCAAAAAPDAAAAAVAYPAHQLDAGCWFQPLVPPPSFRSSGYVVAPTVSTDAAAAATDAAAAAGADGDAIVAATV